MKLTRLPLIILGCFLLAACATTSNKLDCRHINWRSVGQQDGEQGKYRQDLAAIYPSCGPNIVVNQKAYQKGWSKGIRKYCQPDNGYQMGVEGKAKTELCPAQLNTAFSQAWSKGIRHFCTPSNGYKIGLSGKAVPQFCPNDLNIEFQRGYQRGYQHYKQIAGLKKHLATVSEQLQDIQADRIEQQTKLTNMQAAFAKQSFSPQKQYLIQKANLAVQRLIRKEKDLTKEKQHLSGLYDERMKNFLDDA